MARPTLRSLEDLREWFLEQDCPIWTVYFGETKGRHRMTEQNNKDLSVEESWEILANNLYRLTGKGKICVAVNVKGATNRSGDHEAVYEFNEMLNGRPGIAGIGGQGSFIGSTEVESYVQREVEREREKWEMERRIEALEADQQANTPLIDRLLEENFDQVAGIATQLIQGLIQKKPPATVAGFQQSGPQPSGGDRQAPESQEEASERISEALQRLSATFPDVLELLEGLADFVEAQPELAKTLFENQILGK